eukprot:TRINITY_DN39984_c0_g1_i1.p1 TRINITY_DN39984_c0_g1~~TRINITY_DN39984_c0_g1_i1.p1  ORF type:complete len:501 (-),score=116.67 TRINITY_DN39984_c0_g1_i1:92-1594(-)
MRHISQMKHFYSTDTTLSKTLTARVAVRRPGRQQPPPAGDDMAGRKRRSQAAWLCLDNAAGCSTHDVAAVDCHWAQRRKRQRRLLLEARPKAELVASKPSSSVAGGPDSSTELPSSSDEGNFAADGNAAVHPSPGGHHGRRAASSTPLRKAGDRRQARRRQKGAGHQVREGKSAKRVEAQLHDLLKHLTPATRQALLSKGFTEAQRLGLEHFMLAQRQKAEMDTEIDAAKAAAGDAVSGTNTKKTSESMPPADTDRDDKCGLHMIRRCGYTLYRPTIHVGPFRLTAGTSTKQEEAMEYQKVLRDVRRTVMMQAEDSSMSFEDRFREALATVPQRAASGRAASKLTLRFVASVPASIWIGRSLHTPSYATAPAESLERGLAAWRRLDGLRSRVLRCKVNRYSLLHHHSPEDLAEAWSALRQAYVDLWCETGHPPAQVEARLDALQKRQRPALERLVGRWERRLAAKQAAARSEASSAAKSDAKVERKVRKILAKWEPTRHP